jgi:hypothetical protein
MRRLLLSATVSDWRRKRAQQQLQKRLMRALKLVPRGGGANDGLLLKNVVASLAIEWHARDVHPWDRDLSPERQSEQSNEILLNDTLAAIHHIFAYCPETDSLDVRVLTPRAPYDVLLTGNVLRTDLNNVLPYASLVMRLRMLGIHVVRDGEARTNLRRSEE